MPWNSTPPSRRERFRTQYRLGDRLHGIVLDCPEPGVAWVEVDGQNLFARLKTKVFAGQRLIFEIIALSPEIVLKALPNPAMDLKELIRVFLASRRTFEKSIKQFLNQDCQINSSAGLGQARRDFLVSLLKNGPQLRSYGAVLIFQKRINQLLALKHLGRFCYLPWLAPTVDECDLFFPTQSPSSRNFSGLVAGFQSPTNGYCRLHFFFRPPEATFRIIANNPAASRLSKLFADRVLESVGLHISCLNVGTEVSPQPLHLLPWILAQADGTKVFHATA